MQQMFECFILKHFTERIILSILYKDPVEAAKGSVAVVSPTLQLAFASAPPHPWGTHLVTGR